MFKEALIICHEPTVKETQSFDYMIMNCGYVFGTDPLWLIMRHQRYVFKRTRMVYDPYSSASVAIKSVS